MVGRLTMDNELLKKSNGILDAKEKRKFIADNRKDFGWVKRGVRNAEHSPQQLLLQGG
jgi:hypothetical protein